MVRVLPYLALAGGAAAGAVYFSFLEHKHYYPAMVALYNSNLSMLTIYAFMVLLVLAVVRAFQYMFFGALRPIEVERLYERGWFTFTEILLAMTIFRDEFNIRFVSLFVLLLTFKTFHWLTQYRVEFMQQTPRLTWMFHTRMISVTIFLTAADAAFVYYAFYSVVNYGLSMQLLFGFEYLIQLVTILTTFCKYILFVIDLQHDEPWEARPIYMAYLDLLTDLVKLITYVLFFIMLVNFYALPLHIIRDVFMTFRSFLKRCHDLIRARRATANLEARYPNATPEELASDNLCTICREDMDVGKKLPCGHIFHLNCLRSWLQQNQSCPTCRADILALDAAQQQQQAAAARRNPPAAPVNNNNANREYPPGPPHAPAQAPATGAPPMPQPGAPGPAFPHPPPFVFPPPMTPSSAPGQDAAEGPASGHAPPDWLHGMPPPPPFGMPLPFMAPPMPLPPGFVPFHFQHPSTSEAEEEEDHLATLSEDDLRALEGAEREQVELRIKYLRRLRRDVDRLVARFSQIEGVFPPTPQYVPASSMTRPEAMSPDMNARVNDDAADDTAAVATEETEPASAPAPASSASLQASSVLSAQSAPSLPDADSEPSTPMTPPADELREIRQRRIRMLSGNRRPQDDGVDE
ncbi:uncharacterized protein MONBRDRAFT_24008 [Monosiga brevicollis MX1]|uniref:RING-type E3 ubiquitin transferase n=1 Tax=Monosiga brevicollis TaxID=81824 RepID=A9UUF3_MONBE|nr:uncharacterized protein MONBRDRAFT_24008 [Monosiga brevicollis MX1]EDQ91088.1 predicted protein [Monosiga brevicollis MX1]|eukprot:XP_001744385.1 hypothetical protein [Monosiga brevicollis MX1]